MVSDAGGPGGSRPPTSKSATMALTAAFSTAPPASRRPSAMSATLPPPAPVTPALGGEARRVSGLTFADPAAPRSGGGSRVMSRQPTPQERRNSAQAGGDSPLMRSGMSQMEWSGARGNTPGSQRGNPAPPFHAGWAEPQRTGATEMMPGGASGLSQRGVTPGSQRGATPGEEAPPPMRRGGGSVALDKTSLSVENADYAMSERGGSSRGGQSQVGRQPSPAIGGL